MQITKEQFAAEQATPTNWSSYDRELTDRSNWNTNRFADDKHLTVRFFTMSVHNPEKSVEANRRIHDMVEYIEIAVPGDKLSIVCRPVWSQDLERFPQKYADFKAGLKEQESGTPLKVLPFLAENQIDELAYFKITTVEKLANMSDSVMQNFMGAREMSQKAKRFLEQSQSNEALLERIAELEADKRARDGDRVANKAGK